MLKFAILAQEVQTQNLFFCNFNHKILPLTTRKTCAKSFQKVDRTDCEIIMFEVERRISFGCAEQG